MNESSVKVSMISCWRQSRKRTEEKIYKEIYMSNSYIWAQTSYTNSNEEEIEALFSKMPPAFRLMTSCMNKLLHFFERFE